MNTMPGRPWCPKAFSLVLLDGEEEVKVEVPATVHIRVYRDNTGLVTWVFKLFGQVWRGPSSGPFKSGE